MSIDLTQVEAWREGLGLLAVPLEHGEHRRFVMLNGSRGNFCLDLNPAEILADPRSIAWSADVGHYVRVAGARVTVQRWDRSGLDVRPFAQAEVASDLSEFQSYLERHDPNRDRSIVRFIARIYGTLRSTFGPEQYPGESLQAFLLLLACALLSLPRDAVEADLCGLPQSAAATAARIPLDKWNALLAELGAGRAEDALRPVLQYMLRHAAGQVFQEAHYLAESPSPDQLVLHGLLPLPAKSTQIPTSAGVYFTPPYIARTLVEQAIEALDPGRLATVTIFDPACGSGEILREAVRQLEQRHFTGKVILRGWDRSEIACQMARFTLEWERRSTTLDLHIRIEPRDSIGAATSWPQRVDAVLMNPPFLSYEALNPDQIAQMKHLLKSKVGQRPDLASAFLYLANESVADNGVVASIIPASLLDNTSTLRLREHLESHLSPVLIAKLGDMTLFHNAIIDAGMYVGKKGSFSLGKMMWSSPNKSAISTALRMLRRYDNSVISRSLFSIYPIRDVSLVESWAPRPYESIERFQEYKRVHPSVEALFDVRQGVRTGDRKVFVLDDTQFASLPRAERKYFRKAIVNRSISSGQIVAPVHIFYPYDKFDVDTEEALGRAVPVYAKQYLFPNKRMLAKRAKVDPRKWWKLTWPRRGDATPKIVSKDFGKRGAFAFDVKGDHVVINGYIWYPRNKAAFDARVAFAYLAILNSTLFETLIGATSRQVSGGQWYLQNRFVDVIPLPDLFRGSVPLMVMDDLAKIGEKIYAGAPSDEAEWRRAVDAAYGAQLT